MTEATRQALEKYPQLDVSVEALVRLAIDGIERDGHGETGIRLILKGKDKPIRHREVTDLVFDKDNSH